MNPEPTKDNKLHASVIAVMATLIGGNCHDIAAGYLARRGK